MYVFELGCLYYWGILSYYIIFVVGALFLGFGGDMLGLLYVILSLL
jgi:hypothetical protein